MLDYARQRAIEVLKVPGRAVLATSGPAGVQVSEFPCEALELELYLLVPQTSDHLFNLENISTVSLLTDIWDLKGEAQIVSSNSTNLKLNMMREPEAQWSVLVRVRPCKLQIRKGEGWGNLETIDVQSHQLEQLVFNADVVNTFAIGVSREPVKKKTAAKMG